MKTYKTEGIIIRRKNFGEADRIITVFTKKNGKIKIKASGVRKTISRRSPHIELLNLSQLSLYKGKFLPILTEAQTLDSFLLIKKDLAKIGFAYYLCELADGLCPDNQENREVYYLLINSLNRLSKEEELFPIIRDFEIKLLISLGFYPKTLAFKNLNTSSFIEQLLERRLKTKQLIQHFI